MSVDCRCVLAFLRHWQARRRSEATIASAPGGGSVLGVDEQPVDDPAALALALWDAADGSNLPTATRVTRALKDKLGRPGRSSNHAASQPGDAGRSPGGPKPRRSNTAGGPRVSRVVPVDDAVEIGLGASVDDVQDVEQARGPGSARHGSGTQAASGSPTGSPRLVEPEGMGTWAEPPPETLGEPGVSELGQWLAKHRLGQ